MANLTGIIDIRDGNGNSVNPAAADGSRALLILQLGSGFSVASTPTGTGLNVVDVAFSASAVTAGAGLFASGASINVGANVDGSIVVNDDDIQVGVISTTQHGLLAAVDGSSNPLHSLATDSAPGFLSAPDHVKFNVGSTVWRPPVRVVIFTNVSDLSACSTTQDGLTLVAGDVVLLISQTTASQNGVYVVGTVSTGTAPLVRVSWMSQSSDLVTGMRIPVGPGGTNSGNATLDLQTTGAMTLGTTALTFGLCAIPGVTGTAPIVVSSTGAKPAISLNPLVNANISASAAIDGTKVSPNFGSQDILTGGTAKAIYFVANPISPKVVAGGFSDVAGGTSGYAAVWFGAAAASPTTTNYSFLGDGASSVVLSAPGGTTIYLCFDGSGSNGVQITPSLLTLFPTTMNFASGGTTTIECAGNPMIQFTDTRLMGFFGNLVAQATRVGQLTVTGPGSHPTAVNDVGSSFSQSAINNFYALTDKVNKLEKVLSAAAGGNGLTQ